MEFMLGVKLNLIPSEREMLRDSLENYFDSSTDSKKPIIQLVIKRFSENIKPFDGMYLRTMEEALELAAKRNPHLTWRLMKIKTMIQSKREQFQYSSVKRLFQEIS
jgi:hypothetical protein